MNAKTATADFEKHIRNFLEQQFKSDGYEIFSLAGDASARRYCRVIYNKVSYVLMIWEPFKNDGNYPFLSVQAHFKKHGVHVPEVIAIDEGAGLILLEDLGDLTLERKFWENQDQSLCLPYYEKAVDELIKIHYTSTQDHTDCTAFKVEFGVEKLLWEMNYGKVHLIEKLCQVSLSDIEKKSLNKVFIAVCERLAQEPKIICHRDYHSRNIMLKHGQVNVIDFQDARLGPIQYDLVSLFHDSYVRLDESSIDHLCKYYIKKANEQGQSIVNTESFYKLMELQIIQRCFKACGSFASFYNMRGDERYLKYITHTLQKVSRALMNFPEHSDFLSLIKDKGLLERKYKFE